MTGMLVGAVMGAVFVNANAGGPLAPALVTILRIAAVVGVLAVLAMWLTAVRQERTAGGSGQGGTFFIRGYWWAVIGEVVLLFGGIRVMGAGVPVVSGVLSGVLALVGTIFGAAHLLRWVRRGDVTARP